MVYYISKFLDIQAERSPAVAGFILYDIPGLLQNEYSSTSLCRQCRSVAAGFASSHAKAWWYL